MKTAGNFWGVTLFAILLTACAGTSDRTDLASAGNPTNKQVRHDEPVEAAEFYMRKRLAPDMKSIPVERLLQGYEQMKSMTQYSSSLEQTFNKVAE